MKADLLLINLRRSAGEMAVANKQQKIGQQRGASKALAAYDALDQSPVRIIYVLRNGQVDGLFMLSRVRRPFDVRTGGPFCCGFECLHKEENLVRRISEALGHWARILISSVCAENYRTMNCNRRSRTCHGVKRRILLAQTR